MDRKPNRLAREKSPYLLQHAHNPVDWYPWGEEAFQRACELDRPIFLSVGYATCHWCHVMAHESFESDEVAALLNAQFVPVKLDREERPDVDRVYMLATQALTGHGGWPMSVFLTPDLKPFYAGTYFPPRSAHGLPGFGELLTALARLWQQDRARVTGSAAEVAQHLSRYAQQGGGGDLPAPVLMDEALRAFVASHDPRHGGFGNAPKFPRPSAYAFLLREHCRSGDAQALRIVLDDLRAMADGGINDQLGGGFHRYSTDAQWRVPHFEKMLYDQAQLALVYADAFKLAREPWLAEMARATCDYVLRDLTDANGAFCSAEDADSPLPDDPQRHGEGAWYLWTMGEIVSLLGEDAELFAYAYGIVEAGNALSDPHGELAGRNVLYAAHTVAQCAERFDLEPSKAGRRLARAREVLRAARTKRPRPQRDDKIITAWNGLMISALARAAQALDAPIYAEAAARAADFVLRALRDDQGMLKRRWCDGEAAMPGQLQDYAFFVQGLIDLYETDFDTRRLADATALTERMIERFRDETRGGFFDAAGDDASILWRLKDEQDAAEPSGNSIAALNLLRLAKLLDRGEWEDLARRTIAASSARLAAMPEAMPQMLVALDRAHTAPRQVVIAGRRGAQDTDALLRALHQHFLPHTEVLLADGGDAQAWLAEHLPFVAPIRPQDGKATAYVCAGYRCGAPVTDPEELAAAL